MATYNQNAMTLPNGDIVNFEDAYGRVEYIRGTWTAASGTWTGVTTDPVLYDGKKIILFMPYAGSGNATLNLTLSNGSTTGAKNVYFEGTTRFTTQKGQYSHLELIYHNSHAIGSSFYEGWWYLANHEIGTVQSVNGQTGAVVLDADDVNALPDNTTYVESVNGQSGTVSINIPTVNDATLTIQKNGSNVATFTSNDADNVIANIVVPTVTSDLTNDSGFATTNYVDTQDASIQGTLFYGALDGTSTSTVMTATISGITEYRDGLAVFLKNGVVTSAAGFTININNLGAKRVYSNMAAATAESTIFNINYTMLFVYDSTRVTGGCWVCYRGYDANTNYFDRFRVANIQLVTGAASGRYSLGFIGTDGKFYGFARTSSSGTSKVLNTGVEFDPAYIFYQLTATYASGESIATNALYDSYTGIDMRYSCNQGSFATAQKPVYLTLHLESSGYFTLGSTIFTQTLPSTVDGLYYMPVGIAYSKYQMSFLPKCEILFYDGTKICRYSGSNGGGSVDSVNGQTGVVVLDAEDVGALPDNTTYVSSVNGQSGAVTLSIPTVNDATLTIAKNGTSVGTFRANASTAKTIDISVPTKTSDLSNDSGFLTSYTETDPIFSASAASGITSSDITNWNSKTDQMKVSVVTEVASGSWTIDSTFDEILAAVARGEHVVLSDFDFTYQYLGFITYNGSNFFVFGFSIMANGSSITTGYLVGTNDIATYVNDIQTIPSATSDLTNDSGFITASDVSSNETDPTVPSWAKATSKPTYTASEVGALPDNTTYVSSFNGSSGAITYTAPVSSVNGQTGAVTIDVPTVNNATLTIQKNSTSVGTFTANASSNKSINITVPTKTSELTNDSGFITESTGFGGIEMHGVTLEAADWSSNSQTITITSNAIATSDFLSIPQVDTASEYSGAGVRLASATVGSGTVTLSFTCTTTPSSDVSTTVLVSTSEMETETAIREMLQKYPKIQNGKWYTWDMTNEVWVDSNLAAGITSITQTTTSTVDGGTNIITATLSDGTTSTFNIKNGTKGSTGNTGPTGPTGASAYYYFNNKSVAASDWVSDNTYSDFPYKATITCANVSSTDGVIVTLNMAEATSGKYAPVANTVTNGVEIWSSANEALIIPTIAILPAAEGTLPTPSTASQIDYSHASSGLSANNVQEAIDEVAESANISYDPTASSLSASNVQDAIDEIASASPSITEITPTINSTYINSIGSYCSYYRMEKLVVLHLNWQIKSSATGVELASGFPAPLGNIAFSMASPGSAYRFWIDTNGVIRPDGATPSSNTWFNGSVTYLTND